MSHKFYGEIRVSVTFMSVERHLSFMLIFVFFVAQVCILLTRLSRLPKNRFNLQLCASILGALCTSILDTTMPFHGALAVAKMWKTSIFPRFFIGLGMPPLIPKMNVFQFFRWNYLPPVLHFRFKTPNVRGTLERAGEFQIPNKGPRWVPPIISIF